MSWRTLALVILLGLFWGLNWPAVKFLLSEVPPFTIRAAALTGAALVLGLIARVRDESLIPPPRELPWMALTGLLTIFGFNVLVVLGQTLTETSKAAIIAYLMPALTAVLAALFLGERLGHARLFALAIGTLGIALLALEDPSGLFVNPYGPLIMLASAFVWALGTVAMKAGQFSLAPLPLTVWFLGLSGIACWPFVAVFEGMPTLPSIPVLAVWFWHGALPMVLGYLIWTHLVGAMQASVAALATLLAPLVGVTSSMLLLGDPVTWHKIAALALILTSISLTLLPTRAKE